MYYLTRPQIDAIFSRRKLFYFVQWSDIYDDINTEDISNHTIKALAEKNGKIFDINEIEDIFNSGILNSKYYYIRVF